MVRRLIALGIGVLLLIIVVVAVKGCLDSRHKSALSSYNTHVTSIISENNDKVITPFFAALQSGGSASEIVQSLQAVEQVALSDAKLARSINVPGEMSHAQTNLELALDLRAAAVTNVTGQITTALSTTSGVAAQDAIDKIAGQMQALLASDVVYSQRVQPLIAQALDEGGVHQQTVVGSKSLTNFGWLQSAQVANALGATIVVRQPGGKAAPGTHGHGLTDVKVNGVTLNTTGNNNVPSSPAPIFVVDFQNQGENDEVDVKVNLKITGPGKPILRSATVPQTKKGTAAQVRIPLNAPVPTSSSLVTVSIGHVLGEKNFSNNHASYTVTFGPG